jgi:aminoglycoside phosphotransferase (APT) family kinase protein
VVADVELVVERLWPGRRLVPEPLDGGTTNTNFAVAVDGERFVVRLPGADAELLGIDRESELAAGRLAADLGVGPEIVATDAQSGAVVARFLDGHHVALAELGRTPLVEAVGAVLHRVHHAGRVRAVFDHFAVVARYAETARGRGVRPPFDIDAAIALVGRIALARPFRPSVLGHNDLLNGNLLLVDGRIRLIDWEYSGMGDPFFDLANFSANHDLDEEGDRLLLAAYWGETGQPLVAALGLMKLVSELREAMWSVVQMAVSQLDENFESYALRHAERFFSRRDALDVERSLREAVAAGR